MRVVESGFQDAVIDCDDRERQRPGILHGLERADAAGGLLGYADQAVQQLRPFKRGESGEARAVVDDDLRADLIQQPQRPLMRLFGGPPCIGLDCDPLPTQLIGHTLIGGFRLAEYAHCGARGLQQPQQHGRLRFQDQADRNAYAMQVRFAGQLVQQRGGHRHMRLRGIHRLHAVGVTGIEQPPNGGRRVERRLTGF